MKKNDLNILLKNIKKSNYKNVFSVQGLDNKYIAFHEIEKGKYYSTLELSFLKRSNTPENIIDKDNEESFTKILLNIVSDKNFSTYKKIIINLLKSDELKSNIKTALKIIIVYYDLILDNIDDEDIIKLKTIEYSSSVDRLDKLCKSLNITVRGFYFIKKLVVKQLLEAIKK